MGGKFFLGGFAPCAPTGYGPVYERLVTRGQSIIYAFDSLLISTMLRITSLFCLRCSKSIPVTEIS